MRIAAVGFVAFFGMYTVMSGLSGGWSPMAPGAVPCQRGNVPRQSAVATSDANKASNEKVFTFMAFSISAKNASNVMAQSGFVRD